MYNAMYLHCKTMLARFELQNKYFTISIKSSMFAEQAIWRDRFSKEITLFQQPYIHSHPVLGLSFIYARLFLFQFPLLSVDFRMSHFLITAPLNGSIMYQLADMITPLLCFLPPIPIPPPPTFFSVTPFFPLMNIKPDCYIWS